MAEKKATTTPAGSETEKKSFKSGSDKRGSDKRGRGRGFGRGRGRRGDQKPKTDDKATWTPVTKIGRLVQSGRITTIEQLYLFSVPIKEYQIIDAFFPTGTLKDEVMSIFPVQKQTAAGQRTRFKAFIVVGDENGHVGLGVRCAKEVALAIAAALISAKLSIIPVRRGYWGNNIGAPHTIPCKLTGKCGSVRVRLVPAPRGAGIVAASVPKKLLRYAGLEDIYTNSTGHTKTAGNFVLATFDAVRRSYGFLTPDLWKETALLKAPYQEHSDFLSSTKLGALPEAK